jgi:hypothetical protein
MLIDPVATLLVAPNRFALCRHISWDPTGELDHTISEKEQNG